MTWYLLLLTSALCGGAIVKLVDMFFKGRNGAQEPIAPRSSEQLQLLDQLIQKLKANHSENETLVHELRTTQVDVSPSDSTLLQGVIDLLAAQVRANEMYVNQLIQLQAEMHRTAGRPSGHEPVSHTPNGFRTGPAVVSEARKHALAAELCEQAAAFNGQLNCAPGANSPFVTRGPTVVEVEQSVYQRPYEPVAMHAAPDARAGAYNSPPPSSLDHWFAKPRAYTLPPAAPQPRPKSFQPYPATEQFAPYRSGRLPVFAELRPMRCHELGESGMSFFLDREPDFEALVIRLSTDDKEIDLTARLVQWAPWGENDTDQFIVRCEFTGRVYL